MEGERSRSCQLTFNEIQKHVITILETTRKFLIRYKIIDGNELYHAYD